jgi:hypothetical protein
MPDPAVLILALVSFVAVAALLSEALRDPRTGDNWQLLLRD